MKSKKIISIIALAGILVMNTQSLAAHNYKKNNIVLLDQNTSNIHSNREIINLNSNVNELSKNNITLMGNWNGGKYKTDIISFNPKTKKINISGSMTAYFGNFSGKAFEVSLYSNDGKLIKSKTYNASDTAQSLYNDFNNLDFNYGDIIRITPIGPVETKVSNFDGKADYLTNKVISMEITQNGLKQLDGILSVNPVYYVLGSNKLDISGKTLANIEVYFYIDNKTYNVKSNDNGDFNLNINVDKEVSASTNIEAFVKGEQLENINPTLNPKIYGIIKNNITIMGNWNGSRYKTDVISFNPADMKINISGSMIAFFGNFSGNAVKVSIYSNEGKLIKSKTYNAWDRARDLYNDFNNLSFNYGDIIKITPIGPVETDISNFEGKSNCVMTKSVQLLITQEGLKVSNMPQIEVNPFSVLGNGKVTSGVISGKIDKPNQEVNVIVDGKTFSGKSNNNGDFEINISDTNGFIASTNILVESDNELAASIKPTANKNLGILNSNILVHGEDGVIAQEVSFNPATMTVVKSAPWGNNFAAQLISGKTGAVIASCGTSDFNAYTSKDNLNGAHFEYGDIISVYETEEMKLTNGSLLLLNGKTGIDCVDCFKSFRITPNGLVPVENKNLTTSQILYKGTNDMTLTGRTLANTNVTVTYGNITKVVKSNSNGEFSLEIPFSDTQIGKEVRVFVNSNNNENLIVKYDSNLININTNRIEVLNNTNLPIFNVSFNPLNNKLEAVQYPNKITYTGAFFENALNIKLINPKNGNIIYSFNGDKLNNISNFVANINDKAYNLGDIIEVSYNPEFVKANVYDGKNSIGNTTGEKEYFEITNKGLINLNDKFINVKPLDILSNTKVTSTNIEGKAKPNTSVEVSVDGNVFKGMTNENGDFNITINDKNGFTNSTNIVVSSEGYIPTHINPTIESNIVLQNSYINFYNSVGNYAQISSSIGFNPETMKFVVTNYADSFGNGKSHYFNFDLYSSNGEKLFNTSINNGATSAVTEAINGKSFNYGDIIGLSYNNTISKPAILNGNTVLGNISGEEEYFKITKEGLVKVNFGQNAYTSNVSWNNNNLVIDSNLSDGQNESILNANKKLVILNSDNQVVDSVNTNTLKNSSSVQGMIPESALDKLNNGETYTFALDINNKLFPIQVSSNTPSNSKYLLEANSDNTLSIVKATEPVITINNSSDIANYLNTLNSDIQLQVNSNINSNTMSNSKLNYEITTREFITRVGLSNLENFFNKSQANKEFINWVLNNNTAMQEYLDGTNPEINMNGLQIWSDIWNKYTNSRSGFNLKLAIATAVSNATPINAWPCRGTVGNPVERYNIFETLNAEGGMLPIFETLDVRHIELVVNTTLPNNQIMEMRSIIMQNHNAYINAGSGGLNNIAYTIHYEEHNPHTGASIFGPDFYGKNPTILDVWYDGGVCGSISRLGSIACQVFGTPAQAIGQPGHCAFIFYNNEHKWTIGNNIYGWSQSNGSDVLGWSNGIATNINVTNYDLLYENINPGTLKKSNEYLWLANSDLSYQDKMNAINEALKIEPLNIRAWLAKIDLMKTNHNLTTEDYINLSEQIIGALKDYPMPMYDVLLQIKNIILNNGTTAQYDKYVNSINEALSKVTNDNQKPIAQDLINSMPQEELQEGATPLNNSKISIDNYWGNALGTLEFNSANMKINVKEGWSRISAYVHGEAFSIGLYDKNNKAIKTLTLYGGEWPKTEIYNAFNNLGFKYGDKIFIDYKISCNINASNLYKDGVLEKSYNVNKPSVFELTPRGLVYLGDSLEDSSENATLKVSTVYPDGKAVAGDKYNYTETGNIGDSINNESIPALENYHVDYVTVNGVKADINQLPKYYLDNNMNIVYHMAIDSEYKLNINVKTESGKVLNTIPAVSYAKGDKISVADNNWDKKEYKLDYILVDGVKTPADKLPEVMPDKNLNITYVVSPIAKSTITVKTMVDGKVLGKPVVTTNYEGEAYKEVAPTWDNNDYELKDITVNGVKTSEADLPKVFGDKDTTIVYNLSLKMMNVGERVVNQNGDVLYHNEYKLPFNTSIVNIEDKIPSNYKLENITVSNLNNKEATLIANTKANTYTNSNDVKVAFNGEVVSYNVVPINGEITYETQIGNEEPTNVVKEVGQVDTKSKEYKLDIPKGYKVESITVNGKKVDSINDLDYTNEKQVVVYHLAKVSNDKSKENNKIVDKNDRATINHSSIKQGDNKSGVKAEGNHKIENKPVVDDNNENKPSADKHDSKPVVKPEQNHESGNTENKPVVNHNDQNKPNIGTHEGSKVTPIKRKYGEVVVKVVDQNGKTIEEATHTGVLGLKFNPIVIPSQDKLVNVTVNGKIISENDVKNEIVSNPNTDNTTTIIYNVNVPKKGSNNQGSSVSPSDNKNINKTNKEDSTNTHNNDVKPIVNHKENNPSNSNKKKITEDGKVKVEVVTSEGKVLLDSNYNEPVGSKISNIIIPKGYKLQSVSATVNGNGIQEVPTKVEKGETTIIYNVVSDELIKNQNEDNTKNTTNTKPVVNHKENNVDKHSNVNSAENHKEDNTSNNIDTKPVVNHSENNVDKHSNVNSVENHKEYNTKSGTDVKPLVNHNDNHSDVQSVVNHNNNSTESTNKGDSGETVTKVGLPDTGLNNTEDGLGILAGIMAVIAALGVFRRKK